MMQLTRLWVIAFLAAAHAGSASVRTGPRDEAPPTQQAPQQEQRQPSIRVGTEVVRIDVTVLDRRGRPVTDLTMEDFVVQEDAAAQTITSFKLVETSGEQPEADNTSLPIRSRSHARQEAGRDDVRVFLIFWDEYHIDRMASALRSREALATFVLTAFGPSDLVAFMEPMTPLDAIEFTRDRRHLAEQVRKLQGRRGIYIPPRNAAEEAHLSAMRDVERLRHEVTISAIKAAAVHLGAIRESRKDIIVLSEGFRGENDVMLDLIRAANASNAAIHVVDPRGLMVGGGRSMWMDSVAGETGGKTYRRNDMKDAMQEVVAASRAYYLLGYSPTNLAHDGTYRKIKVRLKRGGVEVKARAGYWAPSLVETERSATAAAAAVVPPSVERSFADLTPTFSPRGADVWFGTSVAGGQIIGHVTWAARPGTHAADAVAEVGVEARTGERPVFSGSVDLREGTGFGVTPGSLQLTIAFRNSTGEVLDRETRTLTIPDPATTSLGLTIPAVFRARAPLEWRSLRSATAPVPTALRDFARGDRLLVRVDAFGAAAGAAQATARLVNRGGVDGASIPVVARGEGRFEVDLPLSNIARGEWLLAIDAASGEDRAQAMLPFRIAQ
jgi:Ca-activated chloride channel family protein